MKRRIISIAIATFLLAILVGCQSHTQRKADEPTSAVLAFDKRLAENGSVTFRSWNGKPYRMNSDTELAFFPNHTVEMLEWGMTATHYSGIYHVEPNGNITASFDDLQHAWPVTVLNKEGDSLILRPLADEEGFIVGLPRTASVPKAANGFWPFRMLSGDEERKVLDAMKQLAKGASQK
ncbi:MAG TPA: hypothetical protein VL282_09805 [Tepidisphaeraceae bacterium]|nr:hypothetical protein [Tepidisphaeraceae bacterium]